MTKRASSTSLVAPSAAARPPATSDPVLLPFQVGDGRPEPAVPPQVVLLDDRGRSTRTAPAAGSSTRSRIRPARRSSSTGGSRRRPGPGVAVLPPGPSGPSFLSTMVKGSPACVRRMPARIPPMPQPMTTTGDAAFWRLGHLVAPRDLRRCRHPRTADRRTASPPPVPRRAVGRGSSIISSNSSRASHRVAAAVPVGGDGGQGAPRTSAMSASDMRALNVERHPHVGPHVAPHPRQVAGHVHERAQQGRDADLLRAAAITSSLSSNGSPGESVPRHAGTSSPPLPRMAIAPSTHSVPGEMTQVRGPQSPPA